MKLKLFQCDNCKKRFEENGGGELQFVTGYSPDPAGGHSEADLLYVDVCNSCAFKLLAVFIGKLPVEEQAKLGSNIRKYKG